MLSPRTPRSPSPMLSLLAPSLPPSLPPSLATHHSSRPQDFLTNHYDALFKWHAYLYAHRLSADGGTVVITHPWESPIADFPPFDAAVARAAPLAHDLVPAFTASPALAASTTSTFPTAATAATTATTAASFQTGCAPRFPTESEATHFNRSLGLARCAKEHGYGRPAVARACGFEMRDVLYNTILLRATKDLAIIGRVLQVVAAASASSHPTWPLQLAQLDGWAANTSAVMGRLEKEPANKHASSFPWTTTPAGTSVPVDFDLNQSTGCSASAASFALAGRDLGISGQARSDLVLSLLGPSFWTPFPLPATPVSPVSPPPSPCANARCATSVMLNGMIARGLDQVSPDASKQPPPAADTVVSYLRTRTIGLTCGAVSTYEHGASHTQSETMQSAPFAAFYDARSGSPLYGVPTGVPNASAMVAGTLFMCVCVVMYCRRVITLCTEVLVSKVHRAIHVSYATYHTTLRLRRILSTPLRSGLDHQYDSPCGAHESTA